MSDADNAPSVPPTKRGATRVIGARIIVPVAGLVAGVIAFAVLAIVFSAHESDHTANQRDIAAVSSSLKAMIDRMPQEQQSVFVGDEAYQKIVLNFDPQWIHNNIGQQLASVHGHDIVAIVSAANRPLYVMSDGKKRPITHFEQLRPGISHLADAVQRLNREKLIQGQRAGDDGENAFLRQRANVLVDRIYAVDVVDIGGKAAIASAMAVTPAAGPRVVDLRSISMVVSIKFLSRPVLAKIADSAVVGGLFVEPHDNRLAARHRIGNLPLRTLDGKTLGALHWQPDLPGTALTRRGMPVVILAVFTLIGLTIFILSAARAAAREIEASESKLRFDSLHDSLTGLPNRLCFKKHVKNALAEAVAKETDIGCAYLDLDAFKEINDTFGHHIGDELIKDVGRRLSATIVHGGIVARTGGDEFAVLCRDIEDAAAMTAVCERIIAALKEPFDIAGHRLVESGSIGFAVGPENGTSADDILRRADMALHHAKNGSGRQIVQFTPALEDRVHERQILITDLRSALADNDLHLNYQPLIDSNDLSIVGVEALLRWRHPVHGNIPPDVFIPIAEEFRLIDEIGRWVIDRSCKDAESWPGLPFAVNISPLHLCQPDFVSQVQEILERNGVDPRRLTIEVTESIVLEHEDIAHRVFEELRREGICISLDDFGTGYSSLSYLERFKFDKIKIDRTFLRNLETSEPAAAIIHSVIGLGDSLNMTIVAEGVENVAQRCFLQAAGCHQLQGFLFSKPIPPAAITAQYFRTENASAASSEFDNGGTEPKVA